MSEDRTPLEKEATQRLHDARRQKAHVEADLREGYYFTAPRRARDVSSTTTTDTRPGDAATLSTSTGIEVAQDFATEIINTFMPSTIAWASQVAGIDIPEAQKAEAEEAIGEQTDAVMAAIKASNFYDAASMGFMPDLGLGTIALMIEDLRPSEPIMCQVVPLKELEIALGPFGEVDDRFVVRHTRFRYLPALLPGVELPGEMAKKVKDAPNERCRVSWGWWRLWDRTNDVWWQAVTRVNEKVVASAQLRGEGSCPLIVARFNPDPQFAWGDGPTLQALPELRELDEAKALKRENRDFQIHPAFAYQDDGIINFSTGIEPGVGYPARPWGNGSPFAKLSFEGNLELAEYDMLQLVSTIKRLHFVDHPEQLGKTPPTAEQWMEQIMRARRRIGTPGRVFWREGPAEVFKRFKWILQARGSIEPVRINGREVALVPYDPTEQAQEHQEVSVAARILEMARNFFPQTAAVAIDERATLEAIRAKLRDKIVVIRSEEELQQAVETLAPLLGMGGGMGGAPGAPTEPAA